MYALSVDSNLYTDGANADNATLSRVSSRRGLDRMQRRLTNKDLLPFWDF